MMTRFLFTSALPRGPNYFSGSRGEWLVEDRTDVPGWLEDALQAEERHSMIAPRPVKRGWLDFVVDANPVPRPLW
jgi:hypothetical protein